MLRCVLGDSLYGVFAVAVVVLALGLVALIRCRREDMFMARSSMVRMAMGDHRARHRAQRVDVEIARPAINAFRRRGEPAFRARRHQGRLREDKRA